MSKWKFSSLTRIQPFSWEGGMRRSFSFPFFPTAPLSFPLSSSLSSSFPPSLPLSCLLFLSSSHSFTLSFCLPLFFHLHIRMPFLPHCTGQIQEVKLFWAQKLLYISVYICSESRVEARLGRLNGLSLFPELYRIFFSPHSFRWFTLMWLRMSRVRVLYFIW